MIAPCAVEWFSDASPKLHRTIESRVVATMPSLFDVSTPSFFARSIASAMPTAFGRCDEIVLVCGGTPQGTLPKTLCRPPEIGSSADAASERRSSNTPGGAPPVPVRSADEARARARKNAPLR